MGLITGLTTLDAKAFTHEPTGEKCWHLADIATAMGVGTAQLREEIALNHERFPADFWVSESLLYRAGVLACASVVNTPEADAISVEMFRTLFGSARHG